jgi:hypothetical protein
VYRCTVWCVPCRMDGFIVVLGIIGKALSGYNLGWVRALRTMAGRNGMSMPCWTMCCVPCY